MSVPSSEATEEEFASLYGQFVAIYRVALEEEIRLAVRAFMDFGESIKSGIDEHEASEMLGAALMHTAAISRYFWPARVKGEKGRLAKSRGATLRRIYDVDAESPLSNRKLRNAFEHFDERLDEWISTGPVGPVIAAPVFGAMDDFSTGIGHIFKLIDTHKDLVRVLGQEFDFGSLSSEVARLALLDN